MYKILLFLGIALCNLVLLPCTLFAEETKFSSSDGNDESGYFALLSDANESLISKQDNILPPKALPESEAITADVFGKGSGFFRPFLSLTGYYTDNLFKTKDDKQSDYVTILSPGILLSVPGMKEISITETSTISPGGFLSSRFIKRYPRRLQSYLFYAADFEFYSKHSSNDIVSHRAEGMLQYNLRGGLSIDLLNQFKKSYDDWGTGEFFTRDEFISNLLSLSMSYEISDKTLFRLDYSNYNIDFEDDQNKFRDRTDNSLSGYLFYKIRPRLALFGQYEFIDIHYKEDVLSNSKEHNIYCGARWNISEKTSGYLKAGYSVRELNLLDMKNEKGFLFETLVDYKFTPKTSFKLSASRKNNETDISRADYIVSDNIRLVYTQKLTPKITSNINLSYTNDKYKGIITIDSVSKKLQDTYYKAEVSLDYNMMKRLRMRLGYDYSRKNSNFDIYDYTANKVFVKIAISL